MDVPVLFAPKQILTVRSLIAQIEGEECLDMKEKNVWFS